MQVVTNRYPAFSGNEPMVVTHLGPVYTQAPASGVHEVLVLAPEHNASWADLSDAHSALVMEALRDRMTAHAAIGLRYSQAVVNSGREAGASLEHPHGQLLSMPFIPGEAANELAGFARFQGNCLLCAVLDAEEEAQHRLVFADDRVVDDQPVLGRHPLRAADHAPPARAAPAPRRSRRSGRHRPLRPAGPRRRCDPAWATWPTTSCSIRRRSAPAATFTGTSTSCPRSPPGAGSRWASGVLINVVPPERAADELRSEVGAPA